MHTPTDAPATPPDEPTDTRSRASSDAAPAAAPTDLFAKVHGHEREQVLRAAREADVLPYFHVLT